MNNKPADDTEAQLEERAPTLVSLAAMREEAERFWARARQCRDVAERTHDEAARKLLLEMAQELEDEATRIEEETPEPS